MFNKRDRNEVRKIRHERVRKKISGTPERPRLCVYRSNRHIEAQIIDDIAGKTLCSASSKDKALEKVLAGKTKVDAAYEVGAAVGAKAMKLGIKKVVFDRSGYIYTGRVQKLADGARSAGLEF